MEILIILGIAVVTAAVAAEIVGRPLPPGYKPGQRDAPNRKKPQIIKRPPDPPAR